MLKQTKTSLIRHRTIWIMVIYRRPLVYIKQDIQLMRGSKTLVKWPSNICQLFFDSDWQVRILQNEVLNGKVLLFTMIEWINKGRVTKISGVKLWSYQWMFIGLRRTINEVGNNDTQISHDIQVLFIYIRDSQLVVTLITHCTFLGAICLYKHNGNAVFPTLSILFEKGLRRDVQ